MGSKTKKITKASKKAPTKKTTKASKPKAAGDDAEVKRGKEVAAQRMTAAEVESLDIEAIRRIAKASADVERTDGELAMTRRVCNEQVAKARANLRATIEAGGGASARNAKVKLDAILVAHQHADEAEAGRKMELHDALEAKRKARATLRKAFENAKQVEINFTSVEVNDLSGVSAEAPSASE